MLAPINSRKHYVQQTQFTVGAAAKTEIDIAVAVNHVDGADPSEVIEGSVIKAVYIEFWILGNEAVQSTFVVSLEKRPSGAAQMTFAESIALHNYENKKNVLYVTQGLIGDVDSNPVPVIRGWFKIPKGKQRMGLSDVITVNLTGITDSFFGCGFSTYKEYQ